MKYLGLLTLLAWLLSPATLFAAEPPATITEAQLREMVRLSIQKFPVAEGVSATDAVDSMKLRADLLNFPLVADLPLSRQIQRLGETSGYMHILGFCDALIAKRMVEFDVIFSGFLPCRIAVVEDTTGKVWITTLNMDMMLHAAELSEELKPLAQQVRDVIYEIIDAGVNGDF
ncbi:DUF302 domain-containing protein [Thiorhodospira sibirica]|uniref:DUF302 domain-containing protein n=1 Tax=Thiorhodospira sibirica TaxID=154347 RepID=UPI00022C4C94|nr:DUF302 domain-containing protein [Thiorhodospira sibirica]